MCLLMLPMIPIQFWTWPVSLCFALKCAILVCQVLITLKISVVPLFYASSVIRASECFCLMNSESIISRSSDFDIF